MDSAKRILVSGPLSDITIKNGTITGNILVDKNPDLWWPAGHGDPNLYDMTVEVVDHEERSISSVKKRIGFRTIVLNQGIVTDEQHSRGIAPGANWHFEVNGREIFCKGSNLIPPDPFWPRVTKDDMQFLIESAIAAVSRHVSCA
jgi:beta-mannosidase